MRVRGQHEPMRGREFGDGHLLRGALAEHLAGLAKAGADADGAGCQQLNASDGRNDVIRPAGDVRGNGKT